MIQLIFDTEHTEGVFRPWGKNFVLSCIGYCIYDTEKESEAFGIFWYDHVNIPNDLLHKRDDVWKEFQSVVNTADIIVGHNLKHDINICRYLGGINFNGKVYWDTMVAEYLIWGHDGKIQYSLDSIAERRGIEGKDTTVGGYWDGGVHTYDIPHDVLERYVLQDVLTTRRIYKSQLEEVRYDKIRKVIELQSEFILCLSDMELNGLKIDRKKGEELYNEALKKVIELEEKIKNIVGNQQINLSSNDHLSAIVYGGTAVIEEKKWVVEELKSRPESKYREKTFKKEFIFPRLFEPIKGSELKKAGYYSTNKEIIDQLKCKGSVQRRLKNFLLELSKQQKFMETLKGEKEDAGFLNKIEADDCIHTQFYNSFTTTGRLSSRNPNGQNLPKGNTSPLKHIIIPRYDYIYQWDLSQIEWRACAWLCQDPVMIHEINSGVDQHVAAARDLMELKFTDKDDPESKENRQNAKFFNFRMIYGGSWWGFFLDPKMPRFTKKKWRQICEDFYKKYCRLADWQNKNIETVWNNDGWLTIPTGRRFKFHKVPGKDGVDSYPENKIKNYPIQGMAGGDILPLLSVIIRRALVSLNMQTILLLTVHDSIVFDAPAHELEKLHKLCTTVTSQLGDYLSNYFEIEWNVVLEGEGEYGKNYGEMCTYH